MVNGMLSCDLTNDNNYIICVYYSENYNISISVFDQDLKLLLTQKLGESFNSNMFMKIAYFKENSNFIVMNCPNNEITRLYYFNYTYNKITDKLSPIIEKSQNYLEIIGLLKDYEIYIVSMEDKLEFSNSNVKVIDFNSELINHPEYIMADRIHLTNEANKVLGSLLNNALNNK